MITEARVLVVGGGIAGVSTLYHLTRLGWDGRRARRGGAS